MGLSNIPPQITRLILLTLAIVGSYLVGRHFLTPASFGQFGWYRRDSLKEIAARAPVYAGHRACDECHPEVREKLNKAQHKAISCETCHGPRQAHIDDPVAPAAKFKDGDCLRCHEADPARPAWHHQVKPREHYAGRRCNECHSPHQPSEVP